MKTFKQYLSEMKKPRYEVPAKPGSTPAPEGMVKLYHQSPEINKIRKQGILRSKARTDQGPSAIWASEPDSQNRGFYGKASRWDTAEFNVKKDEWDKPFVKRDEVKPSEITAHKEWHHHVRRIDNQPELRDSIEKDEGGEYSKLLKNKMRNDDPHLLKAVRFVMKRAKAKK